MPNWCYNEIEIEGGKKEIDNLYKKLEEWTSKNYCDNGFGEGWLGNLLIGSGINKPEDFDTNSQKKTLRCRGQVISLSRDANIIYINTETAWAPMIKMFDAICKKYLSDYSLDFTSEESGWGIFCSTKDDYIGNYYIDYCGDNPNLESIYNASEEEAVEWLQRLLKTDITNLDILIAMADDYSDKHDDEFVSIHQWEEAFIEDFD